MGGVGVQGGHCGHAHEDMGMAPGLHSLCPSRPPRDSLDFFRLLSCENGRAGIYSFFSDKWQVIWNDSHVGARPGSPGLCFEDSGTRQLAGVALVFFSCLNCRRQ